MGDDFQDERGLIHDLVIGDISSVTLIISNAGAVRGNHFHEHTTQWVYVADGTLITAADTPDGVEITTRHKGDFFEEEKGVPHAWKAMTDCTVLVITRGPRAGGNYAKDTHHLGFPLLS